MSSTEKYHLEINIFIYLDKTFSSRCDTVSIPVFVKRANGCKRVDYVSKNSERAIKRLHFYIGSSTLDTQRLGHLLNIQGEQLFKYKSTKFKE